MKPDRILIDRHSPDFERRMKHAQQRAEWELGDPSWAGVIVGAFLFPEADAEGLQREQEHEVRGQR